MDIKYVQPDQGCICPMCKKWVLFGYVSIQNQMYKECPSCKGIILHSTTTSSTNNKNSITYDYNKQDENI